MLLTGKSVAPGAAVGRIFIQNNNLKTPKESFITAEEVQVHLDKYNSVKLQANYELDLIIQKLKDDPKKAIFTAHKEIVEDVIINEEIPLKIKNEHWAGDWAVYRVYETVLAVLKKTPDPLIAERASDFEDVRDLLLRLWDRTEGEEGTEEKEGILAAFELMPSGAAGIDKDKVQAIITETGGLTTHAAIIAKSYGIPTVMGISGLMNNIKNGQMAAVDANAGTVILNPDESTVKEYQIKAETFRQTKKEEQTFLTKDAVTECGQRMDIGLNIANADKDLDAEEYADSVGVFRTEFIFMKRDTLPSCDEQFEVYRKVLERFGEKPVIIRTLDIGGDKRLSCAELPIEYNPFLGVRALRFCFAHPEIFKTQIKALLQASAYGNLWIMLPMVTSIEDIKKAKEYVKEAENELKKEGKKISAYKLGIMIEIPSIALIAELAAKEVDFASIGSNDLCQYVCAADRMNPGVDEYYQSYHPGFLKLIKEIIVGFDSAGIPISICGEMGANTEAVPLLIGLGLRKLSMNFSSIAAVKRVISKVSVKQCEELAEKALHCVTAEDVAHELARISTN